MGEEASLSILFYLLFLISQEGSKASQMLENNGSKQYKVHMVAYIITVTNHLRIPAFTLSLIFEEE